MSSDELLRALLNSEINCEVWSPYDSVAAAQQLQAMLDEYKRDHEGAER